ncbi:MAG: response regulator [Lachnospiraceae bacterium]|nr:response regulator [Lachnospiraceae bacterium]
MKKILLVDDVSTNLICVSKILQDRYQLLAAKSGEDALALMKENNPDLILLDICMPEMNGFELMEKIQAIMGGTNIPVIFLTGEADVKSEMKGRELGAVDFIRKPFLPVVLIDSIERALAHDA